MARLLDAASGSGITPSELWRYTQPYRGLAAMTEKDSRPPVMIKPADSTQRMIALCQVSLLK